jgi:hypothetical protein
MGATVGNSPQRNARGRGITSTSQAWVSVNAPARAVVEVVDGRLDRREVSVSVVATNEDVALAESCDVTEQAQAAIEAVSTRVVGQVGETSF